MPGKSHGQRSLVGLSPWGHKESDTTERLHYSHYKVNFTILGDSFKRIKDRIYLPLIPDYLGFPDSSVGKESACSAGDPGSIPGLERSFGEGIGYPLQYSWASLVVQLVKNLPAMQEESACSAGKLGSIPGLGRSLEKGKATHSIFWLEISMDCILHGVPKVRHD